MNQNDDGCSDVMPPHCHQGMISRQFHVFNIFLLFNQHIWSVDRIHTCTYTHAYILTNSQETKPSSERRRARKRAYFFMIFNYKITLINNFRTCSNFEHFFFTKVSENRTHVFGRWSNSIRSISRCPKIERLEFEHFFMCSKIDNFNVERLPCVLL